VKLLIGLGNPGDKYARHRHNVGFMALERIADRHRLGPWKSKFQARIAEGTIAGEKVVLVLPQTYMNESGRAVQEAARFHKVDDDDIIVLHDELDLIPGKVRAKKGGGNAGHNGLRSITANRSNDYWRVRIGIGHPGSKELVHNWVLGDFAKADQAWLDTLLEAMSDAAPMLARGEMERFMSEVARLTGDASLAKSPAAKAAPVTVEKPKRVTGHPAGERVNKQQNSIAENLKKWLATKAKKDGGSD
jgi:peptidyl-tRNA hydrolase, PTH1 family